MIEYDLIIEESSSGLVEAVNRAITCGDWKPQGGVSVESWETNDEPGRDSGTIYTQAMTREAKGNTDAGKG